MKNAYALHTALAAALVVPAVTIEARQGEPLEQRLLRTVRALESLAGIQEFVEAEAPDAAEPRAIATVLEWTEAPVAGPEQREQMLVDLRGEVQRLQGEFDLIAPEAMPELPPALEFEPTGAMPPMAPTTGLDDSGLRALAAIREPLPRVPAVRPNVPKTPNAGDAAAHEPEGYTADALRLARVRYRQGRWQDVVDLLAQAEDAESVYWRARALERLERYDAALADYRAVIAMPDAGATAKRAKEDSDFLAWRLSFENKTGAKPSGKTPK